MIRRILGIIFLLIGLAGIALSVLGTRFGHQVLDSVATAVSDALILTSQTLDTVQDSLLLTKDTVGAVSDSLDTVELTADDLGDTIVQTRPLLDQIAAITSEDLPASVEAIEATVPSMTQAAATIDTTLTTLNNIRFEETIPIIDYTFSWSLGVDYSPDVPFQQSVQQIGDSLEPLPGRLRSLKVYVNVTSENMQTISNDVHTIADDLAAINDQIEAINPLLDEYIATVTTINDNTRQTRASINDQLESLKTGVTAVMIWLGLFQLVPLYLGFELLRGKTRNSEQ
ncbi:MAG: hypothetical protein H6662_01085 [Ardenticatenaceae bacterium]|nr:hypothetical protein [Anaerolineales bacterium]MCB8920149.1 hypothetical protein [Ardenticatenaceae bacterium]MCB9005056.1 hypothetical protein [Ardenticatenaceae bacterium]